MPQSWSELEHWYPEILNVIVGFWGTDDLNTYLTNLIIADSSDRQGFPEDVMSELLILHSLNVTLTNPTSTDPWPTGKR